MDERKKCQMREYVSIFWKSIIFIYFYFNTAASIYTVKSNAYQLANILGDKTFNSNEYILRKVPFGGEMFTSSLI